MTVSPEANAPLPPPRAPRGGPVRAALHVRPAVAADAPRLAVINVKAWRSAYDGIVPPEYLASLDVGTARERWRERLADPSSDRVCWVAVIGGGAASYAIVGSYRRQQDADLGEETPRWGELYAIYTHPELQGSGAGTAVHHRALADLAARGFTTAALWVLRDNVRSIRWYGARRWCPDGATSVWSGAGAPLEEVRLVRPLP